MKKLFAYAIIVMATLSSCEKVSHGGKTMNAEEQQDRLNEIGTKFVEEIQLSNWKDVTDKMRSARKALGNIEDDNSFDNSELEDWAEDIQNLFYSESESHSSNTYITTYKAMIRLSQVKGHFVQGKKGWDYSKADDFSITFYDGGTEFIAAMKVKDSSTPLVLYKGTVVDSWYGTNWIDKYDINAYMPKEIDLQIKCDGSTLISFALQLDFSDKGKIGVLDSNDIFSFKVTTTVGDYSVHGSLALSLSEIAVKYSIEHGKKTILSTDSSIKDIKMTFSAAGDSFDVDDYDDIDYNDISFGRVSLNVNVLDELSVKFSTSKYDDIINYVDKAADADSMEEVRGYLEKIESLYDSGVYYGNNKQQASLGFEVFENGYYDDWYVEPVLRFENGASYSDFETFFDSGDFDSLVSRFERCMEDFEDFIEDVFDF